MPTAAEQLDEARRIEADIKGAISSFNPAEFVTPRSRTTMFHAMRVQLVQMQLLRARAQAFHFKNNEGGMLSFFQGRVLELELELRELGFELDGLTLVDAGHV
jgi:hypothetical protein